MIILIPDSESRDRSGHRHGAVMFAATCAVAALQVTVVLQVAALAADALDADSFITALQQPPAGRGRPGPRLPGRLAGLGV
jgi:hypothetical protein